MSHTSEASVPRFDTFLAEHTDFLSHSDTTQPPNTECPICTEGITEHICVKIVNIEGCKHLIGLECLRRMFVHSSTNEVKCPLCRAQWVLEDDNRASAALGNIHDFGNGYGIHDGYQPVRGVHVGTFNIGIQNSGADRDAFVQVSNAHYGGDFSLRPEIVQLGNSRPVYSSRQRNHARRPDASHHASSRQNGAPHHHDLSRHTCEFRHTPFRFLDTRYISSFPTVFTYPSISHPHQSSHGRQSTRVHVGHDQMSRDPFEDVFFEGFARHFFGLNDEHDFHLSHVTARGDSDCRHSDGYARYH